MKRSVAWLLTAALLLGGCGAPKPQEPTEEITLPEPTEPPAFAEYEPVHSVEVLTRGAVSRYEMQTGGYYRMLPMKEGFLLLSGNRETTLTWLHANGQTTVSTLSVRLSPEGTGYWLTAQGLSYYDTARHCLVFLDDLLVESARFLLPEEIAGQPVLSEDGLVVYYYTGDALRCLELRTGISRLLKESNFPGQQVQDLHFEDQVLECLVSDGTQDRTLFISTETGKTLFETPGAVSLESQGQHYFTNWQEAGQQLLLFGQRGQTIQRLTADLRAEYLPLFGSDLLLSLDCDDTGTGMTCYDQSKGNQLSRIRLAGVGKPLGMKASEGKIWFLAEELFTGEQALYCWDTAVEATTLENSFLSPYYTAQSPDHEGLERCQTQAQALADAHGVRIELWQDAVEPLPQDYTATGEYVVSVYERYLKELEKALNAFPKTVFERLGKKSRNGKLTISLVREVCGTNELGGQTQEEGVHFWSNGNAYLVLMMTDNLQRSFYHELFHAMDSYIMTETKVYDDWHKLNPVDFTYDYSYITNQYRDPKDYLNPENRAFIDLYSMSYPKEDRARILEFAILEGNAQYFASDIMHRKLETLCQGIRKAFKLPDDQACLWEQYL